MLINYNLMNLSDLITETKEVVPICSLQREISQ